MLNLRVAVLRAAETYLSCPLCSTKLNKKNTCDCRSTKILHILVLIYLVAFLDSDSPAIVKVEINIIISWAMRAVTVPRLAITMTTHNIS